MGSNNSLELLQVSATAESVQVAGPAISIEPMTAAPLDVQAVLDKAETLRSEASKNWTKFVVAGRNATIKTMHKVYGLYFAVMSNDAKEKVLGKLKAKLPEGKIRANTKEAAVFVRYVFGEDEPGTGFNDKQVHVYSVALEVAHSKGILPNDFTAWVKGHVGGFEAIRASAASTDRESSKAKAWELGMDWARGAEAVETIKAEGWDENEPCRILIAVPNGDGTAGVKDTEMTLDQVQAVLSVYAKAVAERNKPKGKKRTAPSAAQQKVRRKLKDDLVYQQQLEDEAAFNLKDAKKRDHKIDMEKAETSLALAKARIVGIRASMKAYEAEGAAE